MVHKFQSPEFSFTNMICEAQQSENMLDVD